MLLRLTQQVSVTHILVSNFTSHHNIGASKDVSLFWVSIHYENNVLLYPHTMKLLGVYWFHSICPSLCPHLQFWLNSFHIYTSYQATSECVLHVKFVAKLQNFNFWQICKICHFVEWVEKNAIWNHWIQLACKLTSVDKSVKKCHNKICLLSSVFSSN